MESYNTGYVLSGGAARGFAHVGALKALEEYGMKPSIISAASVGAIVGAFYADGFAPEEIFELFKKKKFFEIADLSFKGSGLLDINGIKKILKKNIRAQNLEDLSIPLYVALTNLNTGKIEYSKEGNLVKYIIASSSIPVLFTPVKIGEYSYVDGGVVDNFPVFPLIDKCKILVGVDVYPLGPSENIKGLINVALRSFHIGVNANLTSKKKVMDIFIEPSKLKDYGMLDVNKGSDMVELGYVQAKVEMEKYLKSKK